MGRTTEGIVNDIKNKLTSVSDLERGFHGLELTNEQMEVLENGQIISSEDAVTYFNPFVYRVLQSPNGRLKKESLMVHTNLSTLPSYLKKWMKNNLTLMLEQLEK